MLKFILSETKTRQPLTIEESIVRLVRPYALPPLSKYDSFILCPNCKNVLETDYQKYCKSCGQKLKWPARKKIKQIWLDDDR